MYKQDLALNNLQGLICRKTEPAKQIEVFNYYTWNHLTVCKQMSSGLFKNVTYKLFTWKSFV